MKENYQLILDKTLEKIKTADKKPTLLIHSCCAPCSSYVLEYLSKFFDITVFYYNPNISPAEEFEKRAKEQCRLIEEMLPDSGIKTVIADYDANEFFETVKGLENEPEGGERCKKCFALRLEKTAELAKKQNFDFFTTTLTISPHKNAQILNETGKEAALKYGVNYLFSDFKKKNGYRRSCELSEQYGLYRQNYCGCIFSKIEAQKRENEKLKTKSEE